MTMERRPKRAGAASPATPVLTPPAPRGSTPASSRATDPHAKTERAPISSPEAGKTLESQHISEPEPESAGRSGPTTESVSTLETSSAIRRLQRARTLWVAAGVAAVAAAAAGSMWILGGRSGHPGPLPSAGHDGPPAATAFPTTAPPSAPTALAKEPTVVPDLAPPASAATTTAPSARPSASAAAAARPVKPTGTAGSAGRLERILGGRD
jgi:hypothetical protein